MKADARGGNSYIRTLFILGRTSNLPTVISNCLAGWILSVGPHLRPSFYLLCVGVMAIYLGGMFLNDAFDADFDRRYRAERPIPSGIISEREVWRWGFGLLLGGWVALMFLGLNAGIWGAVLVALVLIYDAIHKAFVLAPILMALCRLAVYLVASAAAGQNLSGLAVWSGVALFGYVAGLSFFARKESTRHAVPFWPILLLSFPFVLAFFVDDDGFRRVAVTLSVFTIIWAVWCLRYMSWTTYRNVGHGIAGLLAGIVLVDWLAVAGEYVFIFPALFLLTLIAQRIIPAT